MPSPGGTIQIVEDDGVNRGTPGTGTTVVEKGNSIFHQTTISLAALSVTMTDQSTAGSQGSTVLYTFPKGLVRITGVRVNLAIARVGTAIGATAAVVGSIGSVAAAITDATLTSTEADIQASTACTLTAGAGVFTGTGSVVQLDGTSAAKVANLNFAIPDAGSSGNDALTVTGYVTITWQHQGV